MGEAGSNRPSAARYRTLLRDRRFLLLKSRQYAGGIGYTVYLVTILWIAYRISGNLLLPGIVVGVETAVYTLTFLTGPLVDGVRDKRLVYLLCYPLQGFSAFFLGFSYLYGFLTIPLLLLLVVVLALLWDFAWAADSTATRLLFQPDELFGVAGLGSAIGGPLDIASYLGVGTILVVFGPGGGAFLYAALLTLALGLAVPLAIPSPRSVRKEFGKGFREGWGYFRGTGGRALRHLAILQLFYGFFAITPPLLMALFAAKVFAHSTLAYAELYVAYLVGGIAAGLVLGHLNPRDRVGTYLISALLAAGIFLVVALFATVSLALSVGIWLLVGAAVSARVDIHWTYMQGAFPPEGLARISANSYLFTGISNALGALAFGVLAVTFAPLEVGAFVAVGFLLSAGLAALLTGVRSLSF